MFNTIKKHKIEINDLVRKFKNIDRVQYGNKIFQNDSACAFIKLVENLNNIFVFSPFCRTFTFVYFEISSVISKTQKAPLPFA